MLRKVGLVSTLLLALPAFAHAWTVTAKIGSGQGSVNDGTKYISLPVVAPATGSVGYYKQDNVTGATSQNFTVDPADGYSISSVIVNGVDVTGTVATDANGFYTVNAGSPIRNSQSLVVYFKKNLLTLTATQPLTTEGRIILQASDVNGVTYGARSMTSISGLKSGSYVKVTAYPNADYKVATIGGVAAAGLQGDVVSRVLQVSSSANVTATFAQVATIKPALSIDKAIVNPGESIVATATSVANVTGVSYAFSTSALDAVITPSAAQATIKFPTAGDYTVTVTATATTAGGTTVTTATQAVSVAINNACTTCHYNRNPAVIDAWIAGTHGNTGVSCQSCHTGTHGETSTKVSLNTTTTPVIDKGQGHVGAAVCSNCHKKSHDEWKDSLHTLKSKKGPALLNGSTENISPWALQNWATMETYQILGRKANISSKNYVEMYVSVDKKQPADVAVVIGQDRKQRYAVYYDGSAQDAYVVYSNNGGITFKKKMIDDDNNSATPLVWERVAMPAQPDRAGYMFLWLEVKLTGATPTMNSNNYEEWRSWQERCIACHTTGFDRVAYNNQMAAYKAAFTQAGGVPTGIDMRQVFVTEWEISCEACHGAGKEHAETGDKTKIINGANLDKGTQLRREVCESCHTRTNSNLQTDIPSANRTANDRRGFALGVNAYSDVMDYTSPAWGSGNRQVSIDGKGRRDHQMTMDIQLSKYIKEVVQGGYSFHGNQNCFDCHKSHSVGINKNGVAQFQANMAALKYGHDNMTTLATDDGVRSTLRLKDTREALCAPCHVLPAPEGVLPAGVTAPQYLTVTDLVKVMNAADPAYGFTFSATAPVLDTALYASDPTAATSALTLVASNWATEGGRGGRNQHLFNKDAAAATTNKAMGLKPEEYTWVIDTAYVGSTDSTKYTAIWPWASAPSGKTKVYGPLPTGAASKAPTTSRPWTP